MSSTETAREPRVRHAQGGRWDEDGGIDPSHLGRTWYSRELSAALGSPAVSHPPWPLPTPVTALVLWLKDTGVGLECVCVRTAAAVCCRLPLSPAAVSRPGCGREAGGAAGCWQHLEECHGGCRPQTACVSDRGTFASGSCIMGAGVLACVDVCVPVPVVCRHLWDMCLGHRQDMWACTCV